MAKQLKEKKSSSPATKTIGLSSSFYQAIIDRKLVVLAGAGVSSAAPTNLPGWFKINQMIFEALCTRMESYLGRGNYLEQVRISIDERRHNGSFPPDYQAQILEEYAGAHYFTALQSLDINVRNAGHDTLAHLGRIGILAAIVTTNFDCLIEQALDAAAVDYEVAFDEGSYERCFKTIAAGDYSKLQILKVHGSVSKANSLVDTLKQRLLGRNASLNCSLELLLERHPWLFTGFSAADLETDDNYLCILPGAEKSPGIAYVQWPGSKSLDAGAEKLLKKYSGKAEKIVAEVQDVFAAIAKACNAPSPALSHSENAGLTNTDTIVRTALAAWANHLSPAAAVSCLVAICESNGFSTLAFELLHRFWKDVIPTDREGEDFDRYRQLHGRLGMGQGQLSMLDDLNSTRGEESLQNLLRCSHSGDPLASAWAGVAFMWAADREKCLQMLFKDADKLAADQFSKEISIDCWNAQAEVFYFYQEPEIILQSWHLTWRYAALAGDLPRQAKCAALTALHYASFEPENYNEFIAETKTVLDRAARLNDPAIEGFLHLAKGRYLTRTVQSPLSAAHELEAAFHALSAAGRPPWATYALIEYAKALADMGEMENAAAQLNATNKEVDRWQILCIPQAEAVGQFYLMRNMPTDARKAFEDAIHFATTAQMPRKAESIKEYLKNC